MKLAVPAALDGERIDRVLAILTGRPRSETAALADAGVVTRAGRVLQPRSARVRAGDHLEIDLGDPVPPTHAGLQADASVVFQVRAADDDVIVVDKPAGLVVHPGAGRAQGTLLQGLLARFGDLADQPWTDAARLGLVHRLDKGTSGLLVVGRTPAAAAALRAQFAHRGVERRYLALAWGTMDAPAGVIDAPLGRSARDPLKVAVRAGGRRALTRYDVLASVTEPHQLSLLTCRLETGRTHQIRVHLTAIGHPVVGDDRYYPAGRGKVIGRPFLHAAWLAFDHPGTGERVVYASPLPSDLQEVLAALGLAVPDTLPASGRPKIRGRA